MNLRHITQLIRFTLTQLEENARLVPRNRFLTKLDMIWCGLRYGAAPSNYVNFEFHRLNGRERGTFVTHRVSQKLMRRYNSGGDLDVLRSKLKFPQRFSRYFGREFIPSAECTARFLAPHVGEQVIYKPLRGGQGKGITVFSVDDPDALAAELRSMPDGVVETWIRQHPRMQELYPDAINPIRIQTINQGGAPVCLCATITAGRGERYANASCHAIFALVDVKTGIVCTDGCDYDGNSYLVHPETQVPLRGFAIPHWQELLETVTAAAKEIPEIGYIGWDVAITDTGVVLIEGNNDPGYSAYQLPRLTGKRTGMIHAYKPYL